MWREIGVFFFICLLRSFVPLKAEYKGWKDKKINSIIFYILHKFNKKNFFLKHNFHETNETKGRARKHKMRSWLRCAYLCSTGGGYGHSQSIMQEIDKKFEEALRRYRCGQTCALITSFRDGRWRSQFNVPIKVGCSFTRP